jgi:RNA polymerase sigma-70 factor (ECF subfamily)
VHQPDEQSIIEGLRDGNESTYQLVFRLHYENLCKYACTIVRDADDAKDVVQGLFTKMWEKKEDLVITHTLQSYLYKAVHNLCLNKLEHREVRRKFQVGQKESEPAIQHPEVFPDELDQRIKTIIQNLPPQCRTIFMMSRYEEMKYAEIAAALGISVNTIETQVSKALRILRDNLSEKI